MQTKRCTKCGTEKPHDQFSKNKTSSDGFQSWCKPCLKDNRKNKHDQYSRTSRTWYEANAMSVLAHQKEYYESNKDAILARNKKYVAANRQKYNARDARRRAIKLQATPPWLTKDDFAAIQQFYTMSNQLTELNGKIYHVDHIIPLLGKTVCGLHVPWNLQILDGPENLAKSNKLVLPTEMEWN